MSNTKVVLAIEMLDGTRPNVDAYLVAPGLAVHRALLPDGELSNDWNVVHYGSGRRICGSFPTRRAAIEMVEVIAPLASWSLDDGKGVFAPVAGQVYAARVRILWSMESAADQRKAMSTANLTAMPEQIQRGLF